VAKADTNRQNRQNGIVKVKDADVLVIVPCFNEATVIRATLEEVIAAGYPVLLVDDGSTDDLLTAIDGLDIALIRHPINLGQGAAIESGFQYARQEGYTYAVTFDADGQHRASDLPVMIDVLRRGEAEVVLGSRFMPGGTAENLPGFRRAVLWLATQVTRVVTGLRVTDTHNGLRAFNTSIFDGRVALTQNRMAHASQLLSLIAKHRLKMVEVPVHIRYTEYSLRKGQRPSNAFNVLWETISEYFIS
jgi:glycosyltransferase involved in cell wall biosynthesis